MIDDRKRKKITTSILIALLVLFTTGITFAFLAQTLIGTKEVVVNAGTLDLVLEEENEITIADAFPMYDEVGMIQEDVFKFRLVNKTANDTNYILKLQEIQTGNLDKSIVKYGLIKDEEKKIALVSSIVDSVIDEGTIKGNDTIDYELRLWIDSSVTSMNEITGKFLSFKMGASAKQEVVRLSLSEQLKLEDKVKESTSTFPNFKAISSETNGRGIYKYQEDGIDIYYWRGAVDEVEGAENHLLFANMCWEFVRTTKTGGIKMIYDGTPVEVNGKKTCPNTGTDSQLSSTSKFNQSYKSPAYVGYMYGNTVYEYKTKTSSDTALTTEGILYGYDVEWTGTEYQLKAKDGGSLFSSTGSWGTDRTSVGKGNHYTCFDSDGSCETVSYVYYTGPSNTPVYINLTYGVKIEDALNQMYRNEQSSTMKITIEDWFESTDLDEEENLSKLEDVVYCNDRSVTEMTKNGWSKDGDASILMYYSSYTRRNNGTPDLSCRQILGNRDRFTYKDTVNGNGLLKWPVGLLSADEIILAGGNNTSNSDYYLYTGQYYWSFSPNIFNGNTGSELRLRSNGQLDADFVNNSIGVRPVISLATGTTFSEGDGTESAPYIVE